MGEELLTEDITIEGYVCREVEGPLKPAPVEAGTHIAGLILCSDEMRSSCPFVMWRHCRLLQVKMHFKRIPAGKQFVRQK